MRASRSARCVSATSPSAVATPPIVAEHATGARITDAEGTTFIDFAGGLGCLNFGHNHPEVVAAIHEQTDRYLHQCFMVAMYEPYVDVCRKLAELSPVPRRRAEVAAGERGRRGRRERREGRARVHRPARA